MSNKENRKLKIILVLTVLLFSIFYLIPIVTATKYIRAADWRELYGPYDGYCIRNYEWERIYQSTPYPPRPETEKYQQCLWASDFWGAVATANVGGPHWACRNMKQDRERCGPPRDDLGNEVFDDCLGNDCSPPTEKATTYYGKRNTPPCHYHPDCIRDPRYGGESPYAYFLQPTKDPINPGIKRYDYCCWNGFEPYYDVWGTFWTPHWWCWDQRIDGDPCPSVAGKKCYKGGCCECFPGETRCSGTKYQTCNSLPGCNWQNSGTDNDGDGVDILCGDSSCDHVPGITDSTRDAEEIECSDNLDNDCDGLTDAADDDCTGHCSFRRTHSGNDESGGGFRHYINRQGLWNNEYCASKLSKDTDGSSTAFTTGGKVKDYYDCAGKRCLSNLYTDSCSGTALTEYGVDGTSHKSTTKNCEDYETLYCSGYKVYKQEWGCSGNPAYCNDDTIADTLREDCTLKENNYCTNDNKFYRNKWSCSSGACKDENDIPIGTNDDRDAKDKECGDNLCDNSPGVYDSTKTQTETNCGDGLDNDCDGPKDAEDGDCPKCPSGQVFDQILGRCKIIERDPCILGETGCNGDKYWECENGIQVDKGIVVGQCGVECYPLGATQSCVINGIPGTQTCI